LNRFEELIVPSWPAESITTGTAIGVCGGDPTNAGDKGACLGCRTEADSGGFARNTTVANVDIVTAGSKIQAGIDAQADVNCAGVVFERLITLGRVASCQMMLL
jgi:hypothetical protein